MSHLEQEGLQSVLLADAHELERHLLERGVRLGVELRGALVLVPAETVVRLAQQHLRFLVRLAAVVERQVELVLVEVDAPDVAALVADGVAQHGVVGERPQHRPAASAAASAASAGARRPAVARQATQFAETLQTMRRQTLERYQAWRQGKQSLV